MSKSYELYFNNTLVKTYPYKIQAIIYCFLSGWVSTGYGWYFLDERVKINEVQND